MDKDLVSVIIVGDDIRYRDHLYDLLKGEELIEIVGDVNCSEEALDLIGQTSADLIIVCPSLNRYEIIRGIRLQSQTKILILTPFESTDLMDYFWEIGAEGYCKSDLGREELKAAIYGTVKSEMYQCTLA